MSVQGTGEKMSL